jgi:hypothetical protein
MEQTFTEPQVRKWVFDILSKCDCLHKPLIGDIIGVERKELPELIMDCVCRCNGVTQSEIMGRDRHANIVRARHFYCLFMNVLTNFDKSVIGLRILRDRTTVINSIRRCTNDMYLPEHKAIFNDIIDSLKTYDIDFPKDWERVVYLRTRDGKRELFNNGL